MVSDETINKGGNECNRPFAGGVGAGCVVVALVLLSVQTVGPCLYSPIGIDEQVTYYIACGTKPDTVFARAAEQSATPPLFFWLTRWSVQAGRNWPSLFTPEGWLRLPAWLAAAASLLVASLVCDRLLTRGSGGAAALLLAGHPVLVYYATQSRPYTLGVLLNLLALLGVVQIRRGRRPGWWTLATTLCLIGSLWTHYLFALAAPTALAALFLVPAASSDEVSRSRRLVVPALAFTLSPLAVLPLLPAVLGLMQRGKYLNWYTSSREWFQQWDLLSFHPEGGPGTWTTWTAVGLVTALAVVLGIIRRSRGPLNEAARGLRGLVVLLWWFAFPIASLWLGGEWLDPALAQPRYYAVQVGAAVCLTTAILSLAGARWAAVLAVLLLVLVGAPSRIVDTIRRPVRQDRHWLEAALLLNEQAAAGDLVLVQSGLVETRLTASSFDDPGFQQYATSRLSDFYLKVSVEKLTLPLTWNATSTPPEWQSHYADALRDTLDRGRNVWLVLSVDNDVAEAMQQQTLNWLGDLGLRVQVHRDDRVARVLKVER